MSYSLRLENGDIALEGDRLAVVEGGEKLEQDLTCAILTPQGFEPMHPNFGSMIADNMIEPETLGIIGTQNWNYAATLLDAELRRLCANYQRQQAARNLADATRFGKYTLTPEEILVRVKSIDFTQSETTLLVVLNLTVGGNDTSIQVAVPQGTEVS